MKNQNATETKATKKLISAKKPVSKKAKQSSTTVRPIDGERVTKDLSMIARALVCQKGDYATDIVVKGKSWEISSLWVPKTGAGLIQEKAEALVVSGKYDEADLQGIVTELCSDDKLKSAVVKAATYPDKCDANKRIKQITRQWIQHTVSTKALARLVKAQS